jgi:hypothetical protein
VLHDLNHRGNSCVLSHISSVNNVLHAAYREDRLGVLPLKPPQPKKPAHCFRISTSVDGILYVLPTFPGKMNSS